MFKKLGINSFLYINAKNRIKDTLFLAGTARSGTTWLSELINYDLEYRYMFEPFFPKYVRPFRNYHSRQYIRPNSRDDYLFKLTGRILAGDIRNIWIDRFNKKVICDKRLIKDIRANLLLKWMNINYTDVPIVYMMRHPCAVALSRLRLKWGTQLSELIQQEELVEDYLSGHINEIQHCRDPFEGHVFLWCIENYVPLRQFSNRDIYIIFYEKLCLNPMEEIERLFSWIKKPFSSDIKSKITLPSKMVKKHSAILSNDDLIGKWKKDVEPDLVKKAVNILADFGLDQIYDTDSIPKTDDPFSLFHDIE